MFGLNEASEAALAFLVLHQNESEISTEDDLLVKGILSLCKVGLASAQTGWGEQAIFIADLTPAGYEHFGQASRARRNFCSLSETAEELALYLTALYLSQRKMKLPTNIPIINGREEDYRELSRAGILNVAWADDGPYHVSGITEKGISYSRGDFYEEDERVNIINNTFSPSNIINASGGDAKSEASATVNSAITLDTVISAIKAAGLDPDDEAAAEQAVQDLDKAASEKDERGFLEALERAASFAKSASSIASVLIPFIGTAVHAFVG